MGRLIIAPLFNMIINNNPVSLMDMISVPIAANSTQKKVMFPDQPYLRSKKIFSIQFFDISSVPKDITGKAVISSSGFNTGAYLVLYFKDGNNNGIEGVHRIPLIELKTNSNNSGVAGFAVNNGGNYMFNGLVLDWTKCYIELPSSASAPPDDRVYLFTVQYKD